MVEMLEGDDVIAVRAPENRPTLKTATPTANAPPTTTMRPTMIHQGKDDAFRAGEKYGTVLP
jgi:hypothetical protein